MTHLGPTERRLLRALHSAGEPTPEDRDRVRARVLTRIAAGGGIAVAVASAATATTTSAAASTTAAAMGTGAAAAGALVTGTASVAPPALAAATTLAGFSSALKLGAVLVAAATAVGGTWLVASNPGSDPAPAPARVVASNPGSAPAPARVVAPTVQAPRENAPAQTPGTARKPRAVTPTPAGAGSGAARARAGDLDSELSLLETAQQALKDGNAERALSTLDEHAATHPTGALATERAGIRAVALCEAGKQTEGRKEAQRFLVTNPRSPLASRVRAACLAPKK